MRHMQAQRLDIVAALFEVERHIGVHIFAVELAGFLQRAHILNAVPQVLLGNIWTVAVLFQHPAHDLVFRGLGVEGDNVIGYLVHHVHRAAVHVQHDVVAVQFILMDHEPTFPFSDGQGKVMNIRSRQKIRGGEKRKKYRLRTHNAAGGTLQDETYFSFLCSHIWLATPQEVLQADWQEVWHSPQPPFCTLWARSRVSRV